MKAAVAALCLAACGAASAAPWTLDPTHTFVHFELDLNGLSTQTGRFDRKQGELDFEPAARRGQVTLRVDTRSVNTGVPALDAVLRGLLGSEAQSEATFVAERFDFNGDVPVAVPGRLQLAGRSQPLVLVMQRFDCYFNPLFRRRVCGGDFEATLSLAAFGLAPPPGVADAVRLRVQVEAVSP